MLLMIDNYDSFTYNLVQYFGELGQQVRVVRNDEIDVAGIVELKPDRLVLSPGPCTPAEAGVCVPAIQALVGRLPILGVCLGHQSIGAALGGRIVRAQRLMHGKASTVTTDGRGLFVGPARRIQRDPLPLAGDRARQLPAGAGGHGDLGRRRDHGRAPSRGDRSRACSSIRSRSCRSTGMRCCATSCRWRCVMATERSTCAATPSPGRRRRCATR